MERSRYYVSVQAGTILPEAHMAPYEFEIEATPEEVGKLKQLMEMKQDADEATAFRAHIPDIPYHYDQENDVYDDRLTAIYRTIYELGTSSTRQHIEKIGIL